MGNSTITHTSSLAAARLKLFRLKTFRLKLRVQVQYKAGIVTNMHNFRGKVRIITNAFFVSCWRFPCNFGVIVDASSTSSGGS